MLGVAVMPLPVGLPHRSFAVVGVGFEPTLLATTSQPKPEFQPARLCEVSVADWQWTVKGISASIRVK